MNLSLQGQVFRTWYECRWIMHSGVVYHVLVVSKPSLIVVLYAGCKHQVVVFYVAVGSIDPLFVPFYAYDHCVYKLVAILGSWLVVIMGKEIQAYKVCKPLVGYGTGEEVGPFFNKNNLYVWVFLLEVLGYCQPSPSTTAYYNPVALG